MLISRINSLNFIPNSYSGFERKSDHIFRFKYAYQEIGPWTLDQHSHRDLGPEPEPSQRILQNVTFYKRHASQKLLMRKDDCRMRSSYLNSFGKPVFGVGGVTNQVPPDNDFFISVVRISAGNGAIVERLVTKLANSGKL